MGASMPIMNTDLMRQVLSEQLSKNVFQAPVSISSMRPLNITNLNLASLGDDFIDGKYKLADTVSQSCQYIGFNPLLLELQLGDKCVPYKLVVNGKTAGGFVDIFKDLCSHYDIKLPFPAADSLLAQEFADIHAMDANYLQLQQSTPQIAEFTPAHNLALMQAVYLDPMFPANSYKQALVKKDLRMLRALTGEAPPPAALLEQALAAPYLRVVVKRPIHAAYLNNLAPHHSIKGKTNRFDVYLQPSQAASGIAKT